LNIATLAKTLIFTIAVPGAVVVYGPYLLLPAGAKMAVRGVRVLGFLPLVLGAFIYLRCAWYFLTRGRGTPAIIDPPKRLVSTGPHGYIRNPMYIGIVSVILGEAALFGSRELLIYSLVVGLFFHLFVVFYEERTLRRKFGSEYEAYCKRVPRWVPKLRSGRKRRGAA
jgi:protein-S-isoprenylcysteine O-methyltransferase Ste14